MKATIKVRRLVIRTAANCRKLTHVRQCGSVGISKDIYPRYTQLPQSRTAARLAQWRIGRIAEIFLSSHKPGSPIEAIARDGAVRVSICFAVRRRS
jgi:hypothetical protein